MIRHPLVIALPALMVFLFLGLLALVWWLWCVNAVTIVNRTTQNVHLNARVEDKNWAVDLAPKAGHTVRFVASDDCDMMLDVKYEDRTTTSMPVDYYFTNGMGARCTVALTSRGCEIVDNGR